MDVRLPDGRVIKNVPEGTTKTQLMAKLDRNGIATKPATGVKGTGTYSLPAVESDLPSSFLRGGTFGLLDEAAGVAGALVDAVRAPFSAHVDFDPVKSYQAWRDRSRGEAAATNKAYPIAATGLEVAGALGNAPVRAIKALPLGKAIKKGGMFGAGASALAGFGSGEGLENSISGAELGAMLGAPIGVAAPVLLPSLINAVGKVATPVINASKRLIGRPVAQRAAPALGRQVVAKAMLEDAVTPLRAGQALDNANARGVPLALGDLGDNLRGLTGSLSRKPGKARTLVRDMVDARQAAQNERVRGAVSRDLGDIANPFEQSDALIKQANDAASPLYKEAFAGGSVAPLEHQFENAFRESSAAVADANRALTTARNMTTMTKAGVSRANENVYANSAALRHDRAAGNSVAEAEANLASAQSAHEANLARLRAAQEDGSANAPGAVWSPRIQQFLDDPIMKAGLAKGVEVQRLEALANGQRFDPTEYAITGFADDGAPIVASVPNSRTLDAGKRGLDELIDAYPKDMNGKPILDQRGRAIDQVRKSFLKELDTINPSYGQARAAYAGPASERQAMFAGKAALNHSDEEIERATSRLSDAGKKQFALGFRSAIAEALDRRVDGADKVGALLGSPRKRKALAKVFGSEEGLDNFLRTMADERLGNETYRAVRTGSPTAERAAEDENTGNLVEQGGLAAYNVVRGNVPGLLRQGVTAAQDFRRFGAGKSAQRAREDAAALLTETNPVKLRESLREALRNQALLRAQLATRRKAAIAGSVGAGELAGSIVGPSQ